MVKKSILILAYSKLSSDPRVLKQILALQKDYNIVTAGYGPFNDQIEFLPLHIKPTFSLLRKIKRLFQFVLRQYDAYYWDISKTTFYNTVRGRKFDMIIANDIDTLPLAVKLSNGYSKIYFDAHEYHPREFEENYKWRFFKQKQNIYLCKKYFLKVDKMSTVNEGIREEYSKNFNVNPIVITNASNYIELHPISISTDIIRIIHHGAAIPGRKLESMIEMMRFLNRNYSLDFMLAGNETPYAKSLKQLAAHDDRIRFIEPVESKEICKKINDYDIGLYILQSTNFNNLHALPNKFFEFIQARLCLAISPSPEMAKLVNNYDLGIVSTDFTGKTMAEKINALTIEKIMYHKNNSHRAANRLSSEKNIELIKNLTIELIGK